MAWAVVLLTCGLAHPAGSASDASTLCLDSAIAAADRYDIPRNVLVAISLVESGQSRNGRYRPWPWTVNEGGKGQWFASRAEAALQAQTAIDAGATNVDLGCFQLNYRWHGEHFAAVDDMLDPDRNARYAASFLARLHADIGNWPDAAAAYHSGTPQFADPYRARFQTTLASLEGSELPRTIAEPAVRANSFPLLIGGAKGAIGSLVPASTATIRLIGAP